MKDCASVCEIVFVFLMIKKTIFYFVSFFSFLNVVGKGKQVSPEIAAAFCAQFQKLHHELVSIGAKRLCVSLNIHFSIAEYQIQPHVKICGRPTTILTKGSSESLK